MHEVALARERADVRVVEGLSIWGHWRGRRRGRRVLDLASVLGQLADELLECREVLLEVRVIVGSGHRLERRLLRTGEAPRKDNHALLLLDLIRLVDRRLPALASLEGGIVECVLVVPLAVGRLLAVREQNDDLDRAIAAVP